MKRATDGMGAESRGRFSRSVALHCAQSMERACCGGSRWLTAWKDWDQGIQGEGPAWCGGRLRWGARVPLLLGVSAEEAMPVLG
jgi:hypothetical protein